jgi:hypothetical protein
MYAELINKYRATNKLKIVEVNAKDFSEIDTKIFLRELNAGEKMHLYFIFENDLKNASEDEKLLFALNMALCDSERNRTENETGVGQESDNKTEIKTDNKKSPGISPGDSVGFLHFNHVFAIFLQKNGFNCHFPFFCSIFARVIS